MKRFIILLIVMLIGSIVVAQEASEELVPFENNLFGVQGLIPDGWQSGGPGVYARNPTEGDVTQLIIQSAPLPRVALLGALRGQLGIEDLPEPEIQLETDFAIWDVYRVDLDVQGYELTLSLAVTNLEDVTYIAILQALREESPALHDTIFLPVVESLSAIGAGEDTVEKPYIEEEVTFSSGDVTLAGTLSLPEGEGLFPAVVLISGSGASDRDESLAPIAEIKPFRDIADYLTRNGIAVLRYDERGVGASTGDIASATLQDFRDDASAAVDYLASRDEVDSSKIGLIGHSEGGAIAPEVSLTNDNVAFIIGLGAPAVPMFDILREQMRLLYAAVGVPDDIINEALIAHDNVRSAMQSDDEQAIRDALTALVTVQVNANVAAGGTETEITPELIDESFAQMSLPIMYSYLDYDVSSFWSQVEIPILAIYGELDLQVSAEQNIPVLEDLTSDNPDVVIVTIENMNHILQEAETGQFSEYATLEQTVMPELLDTISKWILGNFEAK